MSTTSYLNQKVATVGHSGDDLVKTGKISASAVRYIKLGISGKFEERAHKDNRLYLGYHAVSDDASQAGDWDTVYRGFLKEGHKPHIARIHARQVQAFYEEPESCLWITFVDLVDLIFQRSGWPRVSRLGGNQKLIEFELENPVTGERSFAQVKSQASQNTLDDYAARFDRDTGYRQMFFVCHTANGKLLGPVFS